MFELSRRGLALALAGAPLGASAAPAEKVGWTARNFERFWSAPNPDAVRRARYHPAIRAWWPFRAEAIIGPEAYARSILLLLEAVPDLKLTVEHAADVGEAHFVRWTARGTPPIGPGEWRGAGWLRTERGDVVENHVFSDHPVFELVGRQLA